MIKRPVGGALPGFAQLAVSTYHTATASSHSAISKVIMQVEERGTSPLPPVRESPATVPSTQGSLGQKSWVHFLTCYEILACTVIWSPGVSKVVKSKHITEYGDFIWEETCLFAVPLIIKKLYMQTLPMEGNQDLYLALEQENLNPWFFPVSTQLICVVYTPLGRVFIYMSCTLQ